MRARFFPDERDGGGVATGGRISVDSGVLNPDQLKKNYGEEAAELWSRSRLRDRIDAIIIHEEAEAKAGTHEETLALALANHTPHQRGYAADSSRDGRMETLRNAAFRSIAARVSGIASRAHSRGYGSSRRVLPAPTPTGTLVSSVTSTR